MAEGDIGALRIVVPGEKKRKDNRACDVIYGRWMFCECTKLCRCIETAYKMRQTFWGKKKKVLKYLPQSLNGCFLHAVYMFFWFGLDSVALTSGVGLYFELSYWGQQSCSWDSPHPQQECQILLTFCFWHVTGHLISRHCFVKCIMATCRTWE